MALGDALLLVFNNMNSVTENGNKYFADNVTDKIAIYLNTLKIKTTNVSGAITGGTFSNGSGNTTINVSSTKSTCKSDIKSFCDIMSSWETEEDIKDNNYCAEQIATAIDKMYKNIDISFSVTGTFVTSGGSSALTGDVKGTMKTTQALATLKDTLKTVFNNMQTVSDNATNAYMASQMANAVMSYAKACTVSLIGQGAILGTSGSATIS